MRQHHPTVPRQRLRLAAVPMLVLTTAMLAVTGCDHSQDVTEDCATGIAVKDPANNPGLVSDCEALLASLDFLAGTATLNWSSGVPIREWDGVSAIGGSVTALRLQRRELSGAIPPDLSRLLNLKVLDLSSNSLTGPIPPDLSRLTNLRQMDLSFNGLSGPIPPELSSLTNLRQLDLSLNRLTGPIPPGLGNLVNLWVLRLLDNYLTGPIPPELSNLANLEDLDLSRNRLTGEIPRGLAA